MKTLVRLLALTLCLFVVLGTAVACGNGGSDTSNPGGTETPNPDNGGSNPDNGGGNPDNGGSNPDNGGGNQSTTQQPHSVYVLLDWDLEDELTKINIDENGRIVGQEKIYSGDGEVESSVTYQYDSTGKLISVTYAEDGDAETYLLTYTDATNATAAEGELIYTFHQNGTIATETIVYDDQRQTLGFTKDGLPAFGEEVDGEDKMEFAVSVTVGVQSVCEGTQIEDDETLAFKATFVQSDAGKLASFLIEVDEQDEDWSYLFEYTYYESGVVKQIKCTAMYNGVLDSIDVENYNEAGQLYEDYYYRYDEYDNGAPGRIDRTEYTYDAQGRKSYEEMYCIYPDGREELDQSYSIEYHANGNIKKTVWSQYHNDTTTQYITEYDENGNVIDESSIFIQRY